MSSLIYKDKPKLLSGKYTKSEQPPQPPTLMQSAYPLCLGWMPLLLGWDGTSAWVGWHPEGLPSMAFLATFHYHLFKNVPSLPLPSACARVLPPGPVPHGLRPLDIDAKCSSQVTSLFGNADLVGFAGATRQWSQSTTPNHRCDALRE